MFLQLNVYVCVCVFMQIFECVTIVSITIITIITGNGVFVSQSYIDMYKPSSQDKRERKDRESPKQPAKVDK